MLPSVDGWEFSLLSRDKHSFYTTVSIVWTCIFCHDTSIPVFWATVSIKIESKFYRYRYFELPLALKLNENLIVSYFEQKFTWIVLPHFWVVSYYFIFRYKNYIFLQFYPLYFHYFYEWKLKPRCLLYTTIYGKLIIQNNNSSWFYFDVIEIVLLFGQQNCTS